MTNHIVAGLNESQRRAVEAIDGPVLALAGPGSGKTRVLTHRIANLVGNHDVVPERILAVTFTNKAAREMRTRMRDLLGTEVADRIDIGTFHSLAARWLRRDGTKIGLPNSWLIYDDDDQQRLIRRITKELKLPEKPFTPRNVLAVISNAKNELIDVATYTASARSPEVRMYALCYARYEELLRIAGAVDFDDLLLRTIDLFRTEALAFYHSRYRYILVDEYQDTNRAQYEMVKALAKGAGNIFVVGDDDQSIYGWRGADVRNIRRFDADFPGAQVIILAENYRSSQMILDVAQALIDASPRRVFRKELTAQTSGGEAVTWREYSDQNDEAQRVCDAIEHIVVSGSGRFSDCAIMYRTNAQSRAFEEALARRRIPYVLVGGMRFYERREIKDKLAWLRLMADPHDDVSLMRALDFPSSGVGAASQDHVNSWVATNRCSWYTGLMQCVNDPQAIPMLKGAPRQRLVQFALKLQRLLNQTNLVSLLDVFDAILIETLFSAALNEEYGETDGESRMENVTELRRVAGEYLLLPINEQLSRFLEEIALVSDVDRLNTSDNHVVCITMHQAKGLEYDNVFLVGLEDDLLPHVRTHQDPAQVEEERRILYVGITRARKRLAMSRANRRLNRGQYMNTIGSRFLKDIPGKLLSNTAMGSRVGARTMATPNPTYQGWGTAAAFQANKAVTPPPPIVIEVGDVVRHQRFGEGVVLAAKVVDDDLEVVVRFSDDAVGEKRLIASFARLERIRTNN
jgi:DNA helicase-2/ATP-dependent DNA helicase PcrA